MAVPSVSIIQSFTVFPLMSLCFVCLRGPAFISYLDDLPPLTREDTGPFRMPISDKYKVGIRVMWYLALANS